MSESNGLSYAGEFHVNRLLWCFTIPESYECAFSVVFLDPCSVGKAQKSTNNRHKNSVDLEEKAGLLDVKGAELAKDLKPPQKSKVMTAPTIIRGSMAKVVTTGAALPRMIIAHHM